MKLWQWVRTARATFRQRLSVRAMQFTFAVKRKKKLNIWVRGTLYKAKVQCNVLLGNQFIM